MTATCVLGAHVRRTAPGEYFPGFGGSGGAGTTAAAVGKPQNDSHGGGGGGGGAVGRIRLNGLGTCQITGGLSSPPATGNSKPGCP